MDGARVRLLELGAGGDPMLFLHGWGLTPRVYLPSLTGLVRAGVHVLAPTMPPTGNLSRYADRVAGLLDAIDVAKPVFVIGHSLGGGVAIRLACDRPDLVRSLTLVNTVGGSPTRSAAMTSRPWWQWALAATAEIHPVTLTHTSPARLVAVGTGLARDFVAGAARRPVGTVRSAVLALRTDLAADARTLVDRGLPVLFVWGDRDRLMTPGAFAEIATELPPEIVRGRHGWLLTEPHEFSRVLHDTLVVHAMLERSRRGEPVVAPSTASLDGYLPTERRHRARK